MADNEEIGKGKAAGQVSIAPVRPASIAPVRPASSAPASSAPAAGQDGAARQDGSFSAPLPAVGTDGVFNIEKFCKTFKHDHGYYNRPMPVDPESDMWTLISSQFPGK